MEFEEWRAYDSIYTFGDERSDFQMGQIAATIYNVNRGKGAAAAKPSEFYLPIPKTNKQREHEFRSFMKAQSK